MATNNVTNEGTKTAHGIFIAQGTSTPVYTTLTNGQLLIGNTSNDPSAATLTAGSNVTITNGAGSITVAQSAGGSGALTFIATQTASSSATIDFANNLSSTYDNYMVVYENVVPATNNVQLRVRVGTGGTPTYQTTNYAGTTAPVGANSANWQASGTGAADLMATTGQQANTSTGGASGFIIVSNVNDATNNKGIVNLHQYLISTTVNIIVSGLQWQSSTVLTSLRFLYSSGNISTGTFKLYGIQN